MASIAGKNSLMPSTQSVPLPFKNLGNTCYLNSALQCVLHVDLLRSAVKDHIKSNPNCSELLTSLHRLLGLESHRPCAIGSLNAQKSPYKSLNMQKSLNMHNSMNMHNSLNVGKVSIELRVVKQAVAEINPEFAAYRQCDSHEFHTTLLLLLHNEVNRSSGGKYEEMKDIQGEDEAVAAARWKKYQKTHDDSFVYDIFSGRLKTKTVCHCGYRSLSFEPFLDIAASFPAKKCTPNLKSLIYNYVLFDYEITNKYRFNCPQCNKKTKAIRNKFIIEWPKCLVIHIKRFNESMKKNTSQLEYSEYLKLSPDEIEMYKEHMDDRSTKLSNESICPKSKQDVYLHYELIGAVLHFGAISHGHYTSYVKTGYRGPQNSVKSTSKWYYCNDEAIKLSSIKEVLSHPQEVYILLYRLHTNKLGTD